MADKPKTIPETPAADVTADIVHSEAYETANIVSETVPESSPKFDPPTHANEIGTLGPYRIVRELGRGGMGGVYLGFDERLKRKVAIKVMLPKFAAIASSKNRFLREARAAAGITHDHIVTIYEADEHDGKPFLAMQLLQGYPLDVYLKNHSKLNLGELLRIGREIALGLAAAHAVGLVHRDIKPGNIWLEAPNGRVKILDFGLAKPTDDQKVDGELTATGVIVGTPAYMPPEQARGAKADFRADLFSLGVVLYRLATGTMPFSGDTMMAMLAAVIADDPIPVRERNPEIPEPLAKLIHQLMEKKPQNRPKSADEVAERLHQIQLGTAAAIALPMQVIPLDALPTVTVVPTGPDPFADLDATPPTLVVARANSSRSLPAMPAAKKPLPKWPLVALGVFLLVVAALIPQIVSIMTPRGTLVIESSDPDVEITVRKDGAVLHDKSKGREFTLKVGDDYTINMVEKDGLKLNVNRFEITRNNKTTVRVIVQKPPKAKGDPPKTAVPPATIAVEGFGRDTNLAATEEPDGWHQDGVLAHVRGRGTLAFPKADVTEFALDLDVELKGTGELLITLGDSKDFRPELRLWQDLGVGFARLVRVQGAKFFTRATPARIDRESRLTLVVSRTGTGLARNGDVFRVSPASANGVIRFTGRADETDATIRSARIRPATKVELDNLAAKLGVPNEADVPGEDPVDADRRCAEWVLGLKGVAHILVGADVRVVRTMTELPNGPFTTLRIELPPGAAATDADLAKNVPVHALLVAILTGTPIGDGAAAHLATIPTLTDIHLADTKLTDVGAKKLAALLRLQLLTLAGTAVTDAFAPAFARHPALSDINLHGTAVGDATAVAIATCPKLAKLHLSSTKVTDRAMDALVACTGLRHLTLGKTAVTDAGVKKLAAALPLCKIEWDGGVIEPKSAARLNRETAEWLLAQGANIGINLPTGFRALESRKGDKLPDGEIVLKSFALGVGFQTESELARIRSLESLDTVVLSNSGVGDGAVDHLLTLPTLTKLYLSGTKLTDRGLKALENCRRLDTLHLNDSFVTEAGVKAIAASLPKCAIEWSGGTIAPLRGGLIFDGIDDSVQLPLKYDGSHPLTMEAWVRMVPKAPPADGTLNIQTIVSNTQFAGVGLEIDIHGRVFCSSKTNEMGENFYSGYAKARSDAALVPGKWTHVAGVVAPRECRLYIDGKLIRTVKTMNPHVASAYPFFIGAGPATVGTEYHIAAAITEVRLSRTERYQGDFVPVRRHNPDADTWALFHCDSGSGTVLTDDSGKGLHGTINGATWAVGDGRIGGVAFDGRSTHIKIPTAIGGQELPLTIEAWITPETVTGQSRHLFLFGEPGGGVGLSEKGNFGLGFFDGSTWHNDYGRSVLVPGKRVHVAAVATRDQFELFLEGRSDGIKKVQLGALVQPTPPGLIGKQTRNAPEGFFHGTVHGLRISKSARYTKPFDPEANWKPDGATLAQYHFDEGAGTKLTDHSGHGHHGVIENGTWVK